MLKQRALFGLLLCVLAPAAMAASSNQASADTLLLQARVIRVVDGDSLWVRPSGGPPLRLRLHGVDAPEICQRHGAQSRQALATHLQARAVKVTLLRKDTYDRWLARVDGPDGDAGAWLVRQGHAWSLRWQDNPGPYAVQEAAARKARRGLFADPRPELPRDFRRRHGPCPMPGQGAP